MMPAFWAVKKKIDQKKEKKSLRFSAIITGAL